MEEEKVEENPSADVQPQPVGTAGVLRCGPKSAPAAYMSYV